MISAAEKPPKEQSRPSLEKMWHKCDLANTSGGAPQAFGGLDTWTLDEIYVSHFHFLNSAMGASTTRLTGVPRFLDQPHARRLEAKRTRPMRGRTTARWTRSSSGTRAIRRLEMVFRRACSEPARRATANGS